MLVVLVYVRDQPTRAFKHHHKVKQFMLLKNNIAKEKLVASWYFVFLWLLVAWLHDVKLNLGICWKNMNLECTKDGRC
jgi:hypothetical protein